jgi:hypothetical protein
MKHLIAIGVLVATGLFLDASIATALPTMIRLGYTGCATCHYAAQGGGPLNPYGRSIDQAQSLRGGEYRPTDNGLVRTISWSGRIAQDLRLVFPMQRAWAAHEPSDASFRAKLFYRNFTELPKGFAAYVTISGETDPAPRPDLSYDPAADSSSPVVNTALLRYRISPALEVLAGRDQLPIGINVPDLGLFVKARNRLGYYDSPTQVKVHWTGKHHRVTPFAYGPGGNEPAGERESGGGAFVELDPFRTNRFVLGLSVLRGGSENSDRWIAAVHARLGFGSWGILAEHDVTDRTTDQLPSSFAQHATYGQVFWAAREWLVASLIGERLSVHQPFEERRYGGGIELTARLNSMATIGATARLQRDALAHRTLKSIMFQVAVKTVY